MDKVYAQAQQSTGEHGQLPPLTTVTLADGRSLCYREVTGPAGAPVIMLLHGFLATSGLNWMHAFGPLGEHFRVIAPDLCGHGSDAFHRKRFTLEHCADDVADLIVELGLEKVIVAGFSLGGMVAQYAGRRHSNLVDGLVLSGVDYGSKEYSKFGARVAPRLIEATLRIARLNACLLRAPLVLAKRLLPHSTPRRKSRVGLAAAEFNSHNPRAMGEAVGEMARFNTLDWLHEIKLPTAVLVTLRDGLFPPKEQRTMAQAIAGASLHEFDGGHVSCRLPAYAEMLVDVCRHLSARISPVH